MRVTLWLAAIYNFIWGGMAILAPEWTFHMAGMPLPNYPELWQCIGMIVGVYGVGFGLAGFNPLRHWPVVLVGLMGKVFGPIGFLNAALHDRMPWRLGWTIVTNDLIWWVPFSLILIAAYKASLDIRRIASPEVQRMALKARTQFGMNLLELSERGPVLMVFLRHTGCTFCREALWDLAAQRMKIERTGTRLALIHMEPESVAARLFGEYGLEDVARVSDPNRNLYRAFGLSRGTLVALYGPWVIWRGFQTWILRGHKQRWAVADAFQMPGVYLVFHGEVMRGYRHASAADRPDYVALTQADPSLV